MAFKYIAYCTVDGCGRKCVNQGSGLCDTHERAAKADAKQSSSKNPVGHSVKKVSDKRADLHKRYLELREKWLFGKTCAVFPRNKATEVHHKKGRNGYADKWAQDNNVPLLIDVRFWLPVCRTGHVMITNKPEWAIEKGFSVSPSATV